MDIPTSLPSEALRFGPFVLYPQQRLLLENGRQVDLGGKAMDLLLVFLEHPGQTLSKTQLMAKVWPTTIVDEISVRVHMVALRKALGESRRKEHYILTLPQQGYRFVAEVALLQQAAAEEAKTPANLPALLNATLGRETETAAAVRLLSSRRMLTLIGPGGIGKSTVAIRASERVSDHFADGIHFLDVSQLPEQIDLAMALTHSLALDTPHQLPRFFEPLQMLLVLDNCEPLVEQCAHLVERLMRLAPRLTVLATSREPIRAEAESVLHLGPLPYPVACDRLSPTEAMDYAAIALFVSRAQAKMSGFELTSDNLSQVKAICRRLDGIPLAIELASANVDVLGLGGLCAQLDQGLLLLGYGRRNAQQRHRTLEATLDWSYGLLSPQEQLCFRVLAMFSGAFSLGQAMDAFHFDEQARCRLLQDITQLVNKSLLEADSGGEVAKYRYLDTTRSYALDKLKECEQGQMLVGMTEPLTAHY
ncbi:ATP-binding protein [Gallaecimonas mangrovi]|uniref:ATP-binding protein n=1 Tax=Gallaecimonas mangrovi TaxID=2291597 RepID=UPI000E201CF2|nr:winged helix-turn-helix domain-containing protein [Gallaecimonas mangrovi]